MNSDPGFGRGFSCTKSVGQNGVLTPEPDAGPEPDAVNAGPKPDAVNAGPEPDAINAGPEPDVVNAGPEPDAVNARPEPDAGPEPNAVNAGPEPDAGPQPNAVNASLIRKCNKCKSKGYLLVGDFLQWKKETMKEYELFKISMQECREANWPCRCCVNLPRDVHRYVEHACLSWCKHVWTCVRRARSLVDARGHAERCASDHEVTLSVRKKLVLVNFAWEGGSALGPRLVLPWRKGEDREWPAREGGHDLPVMRGGWPGWTRLLVTAYLAMEK
ncbi:hypothetical protein CDL15_Pgr005072 [Punica granatum]|uniref:Uncharacterized protein n=1 Tax=Punica granatum TaxID=22663 RepID=A0A218XQU2_PUNGR|nr:hypothetical protein CDL15_Pgr005072 [Punica granatum]